MFIVFPPIAFIFLFLIFYKNESWRSSILSAAVSFGLLVTALTETLSLFRAIAFNWVLAGWIVIDLVLIFLYLRVIKKTQPTAPFRLREMPVFLWVLLGGVALIAATVGLIAIVAPPNNWDSMAYHMPRVMHWIQKGLEFQYLVKL